MFEGVLKGACRGLNGFNGWPTGGFKGAAFPLELSLRNCLQSWFLGSPSSQNVGSPKNVDENIFLFPSFLLSEIWGLPKM